MDRFAELEAFVAVVEAGGFNAAARHLNRSAPTTTRLIAGLEERVGTRLLTRTTRQVALTEAGERLYGDARRLLDDLFRAEASAAGAHEAPQGTLSVTAPAIFGRRYIAPLIRSFIDAHPAVSARVLFVDRIVNVIDEGLDVAVRIGELPDSSLTAVRVGYVRSVTVAAPRYIAEHNPPQKPEELSEHRLAAPLATSASAVWEFVAQRRRKHISIQPCFFGNSIDACIDAALSGWAITRVLSYQVADALRHGDLVELLPEYEDRRMPIHLVHAEGPLRAAKIRAFVDHAARRLRREAAHWLA